MHILPSLMLRLGHVSGKLLASQTQSHHGIADFQTGIGGFHYQKHSSNTCTLYHIPISKCPRSRSRQHEVAQEVLLIRRKYS